MAVRYCLRISEIRRTNKRIEKGKLEKDTKIVPSCNVCYKAPTMNNDPRVAVKGKFFCDPHGLQRARESEPDLTEEEFQKRKILYDCPRVATKIYRYVPPEVLCRRKHLTLRRRRGSH
jgi:hypothetical protein